MRKPNSIIVLLYIFHIIYPQKQKRSVQPFCFWEHSKGLSNQADVELDMINVISAADNTFIMSSSQAIVNRLNALDQSDFSDCVWCIIITNNSTQAKNAAQLCGIKVSLDLSAFNSFKTLFSYSLFWDWRRRAIVPEFDQRSLPGDCIGQSRLSWVRAGDCQSSRRSWIDQPSVLEIKTDPGILLLEGLF